MYDESAVRDEALTGLVEEMLAMADEIEAQAEAWAASLERLGEERAAELRRKAYEMHLKLSAREPAAAAAANDEGEDPVIARDEESARL